MKNKNSVIKVAAAVTCLLPALAVNVYADPFTNLLTNFTDTFLGWVASAGFLVLIIGLIYGVYSHAQKDSGGKTKGTLIAVVGVLIFIIGVYADDIATWIKNMAA